MPNTTLNRGSCSGDLRDSSVLGARHVAKLSNWQIYWQAGDSGQVGVYLELGTGVCCRNPAIAILFNRLGGSTKRDHKGVLPLIKKGPEGPF
jgi:hypothetical protein